MSAVTEYLDHFRARVMQDALAEATSGYWRRRAEAFEAARPRPGDFTGQAPPEQLTEQDRRCAEIAHACRNAATIARFQTEETADECRACLAEAEGVSAA